MDEHGLRFPAPMEDDMDPGKATKADPANSKAETTRSSTNTRTIELQNDSKIPPPQTDPTLQEGQRPSDDTEITSRQHRNSMLALLCIAVSVTAFVLQSQLLRFVGNKQLHAPFLLLWFSHSCFGLVLPMYLTFFWLKKRPFASTTKPWAFRTAWRHYRHRIVTRTHGSFSRFLGIAFLLSWFSTLLAYLWYIIVPLGNLGTLTAIFNTSIFFGYLFSLWLLRDRSNGLKWFALACSLLGLFLIFVASSTANPADPASMLPLPDDPDGDERLTRQRTANLLCLFSAFLYGLYEALYKRWTVVSQDLPSPWKPFRRVQHFVGRCWSGLLLPHESPALAYPTSLHASTPASLPASLPESLTSTNSAAPFLSNAAALEKSASPVPLTAHSTSSSFLGLQYFCWIGVFTFFCHWPFILILYASGYEVPSLASGVSALRVIMSAVSNALLSVLFNLSFLLTVTLTSPVFASLGTMITIPLSAYIDYLFYDRSFDLFSILGTLIIIGSFGLMLYAEYHEAQVECTD